MAYKYGNRSQLTFLPECIEKYVTEDDPVRVYDAFVDALNPKELGIEIDENAVGNACYDPVAMIKILVYGYSYGWRSSRKLERALHHNLSFIWLAGGLKPDHKTISNFRKEHKKSLKKVYIPDKTYLKIKKYDSIFRELQKWFVTTCNEIDDLINQDSNVIVNIKKNTF